MLLELEFDGVVNVLEEGFLLLFAGGHFILALVMRRIRDRDLGFRE